jgi:hypothetical protein
MAPDFFASFQGCGFAAAPSANPRLSAFIGGKVLLSINFCIPKMGKPCYPQKIFLLTGFLFVLTSCDVDTFPAYENKSSPPPPGLVPSPPS